MRVSRHDARAIPHVDHCIPLLALCDGGNAAPLGVPDLLPIDSAAFAAGAEILLSGACHVSHHGPHKLLCRFGGVQDDL
jgi:hypothetical protein